MKRKSPSRLSVKGRRKRSAALMLAQVFREHGYVRTPNAGRRRAQPSDYKKGWEVRLVPRTRRELLEIRRLLRKSGVKPARSFQKHKQWVQPIYGHDNVNRLLSLVRRRRR